MRRKLNSQTHNSSSLTYREWESQEATKSTKMSSIMLMILLLASITALISSPLMFRQVVVWAANLSLLKKPQTVLSRREKRATILISILATNLNKTHLNNKYQLSRNLCHHNSRLLITHQVEVQEEIYLICWAHPQQIPICCPSLKLKLARMHWTSSMI